MLNEKQKEFILKNHKDKSIRQMARDLNASRSDIETFVEETRKTQPPSILSKYKKILIPFSILILLITHLALRYNTFWLSHVPGDQNQYVGLAMKLDQFGLDGYNLRGIDLRSANKERQIVVVSPSKDKEGSLLAGLKQAGAGYYDIPFFHKGPAFPIALMISHQIFARNKDYLIVGAHLGKQVSDIKPEKFFSSQFYAAIVPLFFSTALMLLTFYFGKILFSHRTGIYAAFIMAINPVSILTAHKLWADDMLAVFVMISAILFYIAQERDKLWLSFLGGICCGIAFLTKQTGILICGGVIVYSILIKRSFKHLISYGMGVALLFFPWIYKIYKTYGNPLYMPVNPDILETDTTGWFKRVSSRPHPFKLFVIGASYISPPFILTYITLKKFICRLRLWNPKEKMNKEGSRIAFLWFWILAFASIFVFYSGGGEHRRMLPAYPAMAILAGYTLSHLRIFTERIFKNNLLSEAIIIIILIASAFWSVPMGMSTVMENGALIMKPF